MKCGICEPAFGVCLHVSLFGQSQLPYIEDLCLWRVVVYLAMTVSSLVLVPGPCGYRHSALEDV